MMLNYLSKSLHISNMKNILKAAISCTFYFHIETIHKIQLRKICRKVHMNLNILHVSLQSALTKGRQKFQVLLHLLLLSDQL